METWTQGEKNISSEYTLTSRLTPSLIRSAQPSQSLFFLLGSPSEVRLQGSRPSPKLPDGNLRTHMTMPFTPLRLLAWKYCDPVAKMVWKNMTPLQEKKEACLSLFSVKALNHTRLLRGKQFESCSNVSTSGAWVSGLTLNGVKFRFAIPRTTCEVYNIDLGPHLTLYPLEKRLIK